MRKKSILIIVISLILIIAFTNTSFAGDDITNRNRD